MSEESSPGAPAADAVALELVVDVVVAARMTSPPAESPRWMVAVALWDATVSATAAPIAADPLDVVSPDAVVFAVAVVVAVSETAPPCVWPGPA